MNRDACRWQENGHAPCYENARPLLAYEAAEGLGENSSHCCWWWGVKGGCEETWSDLTSIPIHTSVKRHRSMPAACCRSPRPPPPSPSSGERDSP
jgi:hypothetical protein